jgi:hypothetical protein
VSKSSSYDEKAGIFVSGASQGACHPGMTGRGAPSFNGRTADSGSAYRGSNPWGAARKCNIFKINNIEKDWEHLPIVVGMHRILFHCEASGISF